MYEGHYRDLVFYTSRIFEPGKRRRVGICDDSSEPSLLPYTKVFFFWGGGGAVGGDIGRFY